MKIKLAAILILFLCGSANASDSKSARMQLAMIESVSALCETFYKKDTQNHSQCRINVMGQNAIIIAHSFGVAPDNTKSENIKIKDYYNSMLKNWSIK